MKNRAVVIFLGQRMNFRDQQLERRCLVMLEVYIGPIGSNFFLEAILTGSAPGAMRWRDLNTVQDHPPHYPS